MNEIYKNLNLDDIEGEIWFPIQDYEDKYAVSNMGRVKSLANDKTRKEKILKQTKNKDGYLQLTLCKDGKKKNCRVNRLVGNAFLDNPNNYPTVNHNNEIKTDNRVCNLCWMDYSQQQRYGTCIQRRVESTDWKSVAEKLTNGIRSKQVYQYSLDLKLIKIWESTNECGRNGFHQGHIAACCRGELKTHRGYIWSYNEL